jgi:hypothetical protein
MPGRRRRRVERDRAQHAGCEALDAGLDGACQTRPIERLGERNRNGLIAGFEHHVEIEGRRIEQADDQRLEPELLGDGLGPAHVAGRGILDLEAEAIAGVAASSERIDSRSARKLGQGLGQAIGGGDEAAETHRLGQIGEEIAAALIAVEDLADDAGEVVLGVAQAHVQIGLALDLDVDQVLKAERLELIAVLDQDVEIGVDHRGLILGRGLEGDGADPVLLAGLALELGRALRVDEFDLDPAAAGDLILAQQIADLGDQRGQQGMRVGTEIAADQERLLELAEIGPGRLRDRIDPALGEIDAGAADAPSQRFAASRLATASPVTRVQRRW